MKIFLVWIMRLSLISVFIGLMSCTSNDYMGVLPEDSKTMREIYEGEKTQSKMEDLNLLRARVQQKIETRTETMPEYTRKIYNENKVLFPYLPNPDVVMFIYPHLAGKQAVGIPGYSTRFKLYEKAHYALPGEILRTA